MRLRKGYRYTSVLMEQHYSRKDTIIQKEEFRVARIVKYVSHILCPTLFSSLSNFFSGSSGCDKTMRNVIMCSYRDQFIQLWHATLEREHSPSGHGGNKLRSYRLFKNEFHLEPYLLNIQSIALRVAMTRLRVGCHNLEIEVGRYHKPRPLPVSERRCHTCEDVEDEKHFMCICTRYEKLRSDLEEKIKFYYCGFT